MLCLNYYCVLYLGWLVQLTLLVVFQFYISIKPPLLPDEFKKGLDLCLKKTQAAKSRDYRDVIVFEKLRVQNVFYPHETKKPFWNFFGLKGVLQKLRFRDGLVWTVGLTVQLERCLKFLRNSVNKR